MRATTVPPVKFTIWVKIKELRAKNRFTGRPSWLCDAVASKREGACAQNFTESCAGEFPIEWNRSIWGDHPMSKTHQLCQLLTQAKITDRSHTPMPKKFGDFFEINKTVCPEVPEAPGCYSTRPLFYQYFFLEGKNNLTLNHLNSDCSTMAYIVGVRN